MYDREGLLAWLDQRDGFQDTRDCQPCSDYLRFYHLPRAEHRAARLVTPQGRVFVQCFSPAVATGSAVYVHGFYDHGGMQWKTVARLLERGYRVWLPDLPGHGLSDGKRADIADFSHYQQALKALEPFIESPSVIFGHSLGGAVTMTRLSESDHPYQSAVLLAPLVRPRAYRALTLLLPLARFMGQSLQRKFNDNTHDTEFLRFVRDTDPLTPRVLPLNWVRALRRWIVAFESNASCDLPVLVIQGTEDRTVDWQYNCDFIARRFSHHQLHVIRDARHQLANEIPRYTDSVWQYIDNFLEQR